MYGCFLKTKRCTGLSDAQYFFFFFCFFALVDFEFSEVQV